MPFEPGQFAADYEILSILGKGGMGRVYRVRNVISNRVEAMKVLLADVAADPELGDRFLGEIRTLARLDHPNIAKFHTAFKVENQLVMVMEYAEGITLSERRTESALTLDEILSYTSQTLDALSYAHKNGVIHRDIKPSNIMISPHGVVKLMDFGIAKSANDPLLTRPGTTMGSMSYMSPEQVRGTSVDARSDLYSVGVLLYELTTGRRPFEGQSEYDILNAQLHTLPKPPIEVNATMPQSLNDIILTAMDKEPMRRFQSADAFKAALETLRQQPAAPATDQLRAVPVSAGMPVTSVRKGNRGLWMALGAITVVCVLALGAFFLPRVFKSNAASAKLQPQPVQTSAPPTSVQSSPPVDLQPTNNTAAQSTPNAVAQPTSPPVVTHTAEKRQDGKQQIANEPASEPVQPVQQQQQQIISQPEPPKPVIPTGPSQQELDAAGDSLIKLRARAESVHNSLESLKAQQAAQGLNLRGDMTSAAVRMDSYLAAAEQSLKGGNLESSRKSMDKAEDEINKLEGFLGH